MKSIFETKEQHLQFKAAWKKAAHTKNLQAIHFALYAVIMGKDITKTFTPVTNRTKLTHNCREEPYFAADKALHYFLSTAEYAAKKGRKSNQFLWIIESMFGETITLETMGKLADRIKEARNVLSVRDNEIRKQLGLREW